MNYTPKAAKKRQQQFHGPCIFLFHPRLLYFWVAMRLAGDRKYLRSLPRAGLKKPEEGNRTEIPHIPLLILGFSKPARCSCYCSRIPDLAGIFSCEQFLAWGGILQSRTCEYTTPGYNGSNPGPAHRSEMNEILSGAEYQAISMHFRP